MRFKLISRNESIPVATEKGIIAGKLWGRLLNDETFGKQPQKKKKLRTLIRQSKLHQNKNQFNRGFWVGLLRGKNE